MIRDVSENGFRERDGNGGGVLTVGGVSGGGGLADNDLVRVDAASDDLENRGLGPGARRSGQETSALVIMERVDLVERRRVYDIATYGGVLSCAL